MWCLSTALAGKAAIKSVHSSQCAKATSTALSGAASTRHLTASQASVSPMASVVFNNTDTIDVAVYGNKCSFKQVEKNRVTSARNRGVAQAA
jgi:hypothetical protein